MRREKKKKGERENRGISATLLPKFLCPKCCPVSLKKKSNCGNAIAEKGKKKNCFGNCGNAIADNVKKKKKIILTIVAIPSPKMEKKIMKYVNE